MKITIVSSMHFAPQILEVKEQLERLGHAVSIPPDTHDCLTNPNLNMNLDFLLKEDLLMKCFQRIADHDAILVLNYPRGDIEGYVGGASLMEMGLAYYLKKKIFLLFPTPSTEKLRYACEVQQTKPVVLHGNINELK